jgi:hypothetical protein
MTNDLVHGLLEVGDEALWIWSHALIASTLGAQGARRGLHNRIGDVLRFTDAAHHRSCGEMRLRPRLIRCAPDRGADCGGNLCACERNSLKQFTKEAETARSPYNRSVIGAPIGETQRRQS